MTGIYFLYDGPELVYIGRAKNVFLRIYSHMYKGDKQFTSWAFERVPDDQQWAREGELIAKHQPKYNIHGCC